MIRYPQENMSDEEKLSFLISLREKLRLEHNEMGAKFRERRITEHEWMEYKEAFFIKDDELAYEILYITNIIASKYVINKTSDYLI